VLYNESRKGVPHIEETEKRGSHTRKKREQPRGSCLEKEDRQERELCMKKKIERRELSATAFERDN